MHPSPQNLTGWVALILSVLAAHWLPILTAVGICVQVGYTVHQWRRSRRQEARGEVQQ
jgi:Flp pilus assembly protein TadB